ncbi:4-hydroxythreonine-4-phosphate dehydrogenase [Cyclonatronum proteinivorum]|uniref:4-hydroxythreonine-4-phosphate dehydrogenase n=1 Tax=Cyclonatronum proteinivorum TaxID=1457365 RepID=A0A345ULX0_9BACT|nr:4-hydroxythreonine-4-phosphate dehydrogenase PdxA [Cyclonatronum proteinivorum]AXJ01472.1 4-hydroxythreonine-4-phosphate dehydrogenase [Cyclonatronum proteinivorum]
MEVNRPICITPGDFNGIGPETILKALENKSLRDRAPFLLLGPAKAWEYWRHLTVPPASFSPEVVASAEQAVEKGKVYVYEPESDRGSFIPQPGQLTAESGAWSMACIAAATELCLSGRAAAMVTAPISKEAVNLAGHHIPGHTEYLAERDGGAEVAMMLVSGGLRVVPLTTHIPIAAVSRNITQEGIRQKAEIILKSLQSDFSIEAPRLAILGLNPHAGDGGVIGREEIETIAPAIEALQQAGFGCEGPFPADGFFANRAYESFDAVLAMYHDQGLVAFKTIAFNAGVNFTAGLSFIRTSPDHGTAFGIAGKNLANAGSAAEAITLALRLAELRTST